jgi:HD-GYP domain-containing protein (c-di-GMP phosphodiesterase class II)
MVLSLTPPGSVRNESLRCGRPEVWDTLEQFLRELQACLQSSDQLRLTLESVRDCTGADAVFWDPGVTDDAVVAVSDCSLPAPWCREFTRRVLEESPGVEGQLLRVHLGGWARQYHPAPRSAALVRLSKSKNTWIVAVIFDPERTFGLADIKVMSLAVRMLLNQSQQARVQDKLKDTLFGLVRCLTASIDARDPYTGGHSERVARIAVRLGQHMQLPGPVLSDLYLAGLLHDVGKIALPDRVLQKPGPLTDEEFALVKEHPVWGDRLLANVKQLAHLRPGVRHHHERWDGSGYPDGLAGEGIPFLARLLAVADSCDAMMAARTYRPALAPAQMDTIMAEGAGSQWDPNIVRSFMACRHELYSICRLGLGDSVLLAVGDALEANERNPVPSGRTAR